MKIIITMDRISMRFDGLTKRERIGETEGAVGDPLK